MKQLLKNHNNSRGFTMMELAVVMAIISVLATIAVKSFMDSRIHVMDSVTLAETQGLGKAVLDAFLEGDDVDLNHTAGDGTLIGALDTSGNSRKPVFQFSPGVRAEITGSSDFGGPGKGFCEARVTHVNGSKPYFLVIDMDLNITSFPDI